MNPEIKRVKEEIVNLQKELITLIENCQHPNAYMFQDITAGGYYDKPEKYIYISCPDCGRNSTYYEGDSEFKLHYKE